MKTKYSHKDLINLAMEQHIQCDSFPRVGVVIAKDGKVISKGFRNETDGHHAERVAIDKVVNSSELQNSTLFTTLEPCVKIKDDQIHDSCTDLIVGSGIKEVIIGVLDPNGTIYCQGAKKLIENDIKVSHFPAPIREEIEADSFKFGEVGVAIGPGKKRVPVVASSTKIKIQFSENDERSIDIKWGELQSDQVYLYGNNDSVMAALYASKFEQIHDPLIFRHRSHYATMKEGMIAVVHPQASTFCLLIKVDNIFANDIAFQWQVRNLDYENE